METKILIIDDDRDVCTVLTRNLSEDGYQVQNAYNGIEGIKKVREGKYNLIILDMKLPDMDGIDVLKEIQNIDEEAAIIVLTGYPAVETAVETLKNKAIDYIVKPYKINHLRAIIQKELLRKSAEKEFGVIELSSIGKRIKRLRKMNDMSLDVLAKKTKLSKSFLSEVERKKKFPRLSTLETIAKNLGVSVSLIFKE